MACLQGIKKKKERKKERKRQQAQNGVTYAKPHVSKPRLNLITVLAPP